MVQPPWNEASPCSRRHKPKSCAQTNKSETDMLNAALARRQVSWGDYSTHMNQRLAGNEAKFRNAHWIQQRNRSAAVIGAAFNGRASVGQSVRCFDVGAWPRPGLEPPGRQAR